jgi:hypothetical protein
MHLRARYRSMSYAIIERLFVMAKESEQALMNASSTFSSGLPPG